VTFNIDLGKRRSRRTEIKREPDLAHGLKEHSGSHDTSLLGIIANREPGLLNLQYLSKLATPMSTNDASWAGPA